MSEDVSFRYLRGRWKIYKVAGSDGYRPAWYAMNRQLGIGGLFTGPDAWVKAHRYVRSQIRYDQARDRAAALFEILS